MFKILFSSSTLAKKTTALVLDEHVATQPSGQFCSHWIWNCRVYTHGWLSSRVYNLFIIHRES